MLFRKYRAIGIGMVAALTCAAPYTATAIAQEGEEGGIAAIGSAFTYQGRLRQSGNIPPDGNVNFIFRLVDAANVPIPGTPTLNLNLFVQGGLFTTTLDFGVSPFGGDRRFLRITVAGTTLSPNPELTPAPYAMFSAAPWVTSGSNIFYNGGNVGIGDSSPAATFTVGAGDAFQVDGAQGDVTFDDDLGSITFPAAVGTTAPMIQMFASGTTNADRMVIAHSPSFTNWGLEYQDSTDQFNFLSAGSNVMTVDLASSNVGVGTANPQYPLHVTGGTDTEPGSGGFIVAGAPGGLNISIDNNEIMARNNGAVSNLSLNFDGGDTVVGGDLQVNGLARINSTVTSHRCTIENGNNNNLRLIGPGSFGSDNAINWGDAEYVYIWEDSDDNMTIHAVGGVGGRLRVQADSIVWSATKPATVKLDDGTQVRMYAEEGTEVLFNDHGDGRLIEGAAHIDLDPAFLQTVTIDETHPMRVFVQLEGDCNGVFVTNKTATSFEVFELQDGRSNAPFSYRVVAHRKLYEDLRMATEEEDKAANRRMRQLMWPEEVTPDMYGVKEAPSTPQIQSAPPGSDKPNTQRKDAEVAAASNR